MWRDTDSWWIWLCLRLACRRLLVMLNDLFFSLAKWFCRKNKKTPIAPIWCGTINSYAWFIIIRFIGTLLQAIFVIKDHRHVSLFVVIITIISVTFPTDYISALFVIVVIMLQGIPSLLTRLQTVWCRIVCIIHLHSHCVVGIPYRLYHMMQDHTHGSLFIVLCCTCVEFSAAVSVYDAGTYSWIIVHHVSQVCRSFPKKKKNDAG